MSHTEPPSASAGARGCRPTKAAHVCCPLQTATMLASGESPSSVIGPEESSLISKSTVMMFMGCVSTCRLTHSWSLRTRYVIPYSLASVELTTQDLDSGVDGHLQRAGRHGV